MDYSVIEEVRDRLKSRFDELAEAEAATEAPPPDCLYHYTSADGLLGIVQSREIWATNVLYQNDTSELDEAINTLEAVLQSEPPGLLRDLSKTVPIHLDNLRIDYFVASFCENGDLLSQWRAYGTQGTGYSIGFLSTALRSTAKHQDSSRGRCSLRRVVYDPKRKEETIRKRVRTLGEALEPCAEELKRVRAEDSVQWNQFCFRIAASLSPVLPLMKNAAFQEEQEWRLIRTLWKPPVPNMPWPVRFRIIEGRLTPFVAIEWPLPKNNSSPPGVLGIDEVRCGPTADPELKSGRSGTC